MPAIKINWKAVEETNPKYIETFGYQPCINIGTAGHVEHGKSTLVQALTGVWTPKHSEELKRGITIRIGYADCGIWKCQNCSPPSCYTTYEKCPNCGSDTEFLRAISFIDCPGHEALMATMLAGVASMDSAVLVIAADEPVPQPQTREHFYALQMIGIKDIVIAQNKIDIVSEEKAKENYNQILEFVKGTPAENAPIIPISALHLVNIDLLLEAFEKFLPTPKRDPTLPPRMYVLRSFDVNKPGTPIEKLVGGVLGGSLSQGKFKIGDEIEILPGYLRKGKYEPISTKIVSLHAGGRYLEEVKCGGLVGIGTELDPFLTKSDALIGNMVGKPGTLPPVLYSLEIEATLFERVIGTKELVKVEKVKEGEILVINCGTALTVGSVDFIKDDILTVSLRRPVCAEKGSRVAISRRIADRWRLIGYGTLH